MAKLSSNVRVGPPWPIAIFNRLGPLLRTVGAFPKVASVERMVRLSIEHTAGETERAWIREARSRRLAANDQDAGLSLFGALVMRSQTRRCAETVNAIDGFIAKYPEITQEEIRRPLFVLGWPRTGTTLLQRLLSLHKDARALPTWEAMNPLPERAGRPIGADVKRASTRRNLALIDWLAPDLKAHHPFMPDDPEECYHLLRNYFAMPPGFDFAYLPSYWAWYQASDGAMPYRLHKLQLQILQATNRRGHWVLKSPQHLAALPALLQVYPDARIVRTMRAPEHSIASYCSLLAIVWGMTAEKVDLERVGRYALDMAVAADATARQAMAQLPPDQAVTIDFEALMADHVGTVTAIHDRLGYAPDATLPDRIAQWLAENPRDKHGRHSYRLEDFGLSTGKVREAFAAQTHAA